jgi:protein-export membrane protein SecD/preprotein translocase SecF subunit
VRSTTTVLLFIFVVLLTGFSIVTVWPSDPQRYLPGDFWPEGRGLKIGSWERETMRLGLDLRGGAYLALEADPPPGYEGDLNEAIQGARNVIERRVNALGVSEAEVSIASGNRLIVQIPGVTLQEAQDQVGRTAALEFKVINDQGVKVPAIGSPDGSRVCLPPADPNSIPEGCVPMTGVHLKNNTIPRRVTTGNLVEFETTGTGSKLLEQITRNALRYDTLDPRRLLIVELDGEEISRATVQDVISSRGVITGQPTFTAAKQLSDLLNSGALPVPLRTVQANEVSATLGEDSVRDSVRAGEVGLIAVALFMILYYRLPGLLAAAALVVYTSVTLMVFKVWPVTLTLSGIAAFVLSVGMAVDANILIFERMKEELRRGRTLNTAIDIGFSRAFSSIRDSNISTLITCLILYWFGDQFQAALVKGFALTLAIGVLISMFSAITVTRTFLKMIVGTPLARNRWLFNAEETRARIRERAAAGRGFVIDFAGKRWWALSVSATFFVLFALSVAIFRLQPGIEFTSGSTFTFQFTAQTVAQADLRQAMAELGHSDARIQGAGPNTYLFRTRELEGTPPLTPPEGAGPALPAEGEIDRIQDALCQRFGTTPADGGPCTGVVRQDFSTVSETVSSEIARNATIAVIAASIAILIYISLAFRKLQKPWRYGTCAIIAVIHDAFIILGLFAFLGKVNGTEVDTAFITALLTIIGFSVHDTIVVFDRIRENLQRDPYVPFAEAVNASMTETLVRSLNTSITVVLTVLALLLLGGASIQNFLIVLLVGIIAGTYSSIWVASQLLVAWEAGDFGKFLRRLTGRARPAEPTRPVPAAR